MKRHERKSSERQEQEKMATFTLQKLLLHCEGKEVGRKTILLSLIVFSFVCCCVSVKLCKDFAIVHNNMNKHDSALLDETCFVRNVKMFRNLAKCLRKNVYSY